MGGEPVPVERLLHGERGAQQTDTEDPPGPANRRGGGVDDVQHRFVHRLGNPVEHQMHGVGAQDQQVGTGGGQGAASRGQQVAGPGPFAVPLQLLDLGEIDRIEQNARRVDAAQDLADPKIGEPVVLERGLPTHSAEHADQLHAPPAY